MVLSLNRLFALLDWPRSAEGRRYSNLDLRSLSDEALADLNLPADIRARVGVQRSEVHGKCRW